MALTASERATIEVLEATDGRSELYEGELREKPPMSFGHNLAGDELADQLRQQLSRSEYRILVNKGHATIPDGSSYIPDVAVVPATLTAEFRVDPRRFEAYRDPLPLVVEIWSPSTGRYDIDAKIPGYQARGDREIWRLHPFDRTLRMWRRQPDGTYAETLLRGGTVHLHALPAVTVDLDEVFGPA